MACINPDGTLVSTAVRALEAMRFGISPEDYARLNKLPLFRVRMVFREMLEVGFASEEKGVYLITEAGKAKI